MKEHILQIMQTASDSILAKLVGFGFPMGAFAISHASLNAYLTTGSLVIGIFVGGLTLFGMIKNYFKNKNKRE